jgi:hypothetical protein
VHHTALVHNRKVHFILAHESPATVVNPWVSAALGLNGLTPAADRSVIQSPAIMTRTAERH